jgi:hypothetical protein
LNAVTLFVSNPPPSSKKLSAKVRRTTMRKFWFAIIDIVLLMEISYAENDGKSLWLKAYKSSGVFGYLH